MDAHKCCVITENSKQVGRADPQQFLPRWAQPGAWFVHRCRCLAGCMHCALTAARRGSSVRSSSSKCAIRWACARHGAWGQVSRRCALGICCTGAAVGRARHEQQDMLVRPAVTVDNPLTSCMLHNHYPTRRSHVPMLRQAPLRYLQVAHGGLQRGCCAGWKQAAQGAAHRGQHVQQVVLHLSGWMMDWVGCAVREQVA